MQKVTNVGSSVTILCCAPACKMAETFDMADITCSPWGSLLFHLEVVSSHLITTTYSRALWFHGHVKSFHVI